MKSILLVIVVIFGMKMHVKGQSDNPINSTDFLIVEYSNKNNQRLVNAFFPSNDTIFSVFIYQTDQIIDSTDMTKIQNLNYYLSLLKNGKVRLRDNILLKDEYDVLYILFQSPIFSLNEKSNETTLTLPLGLKKTYTLNVFINKYFRGSIYTMYRYFYL